MKHANSGTPGYNVNTYGGSNTSMTTAPGYQQGIKLNVYNATNPILPNTKKVKHRLNKENK